MKYLVQSAIMYTSRPLEFHIICDDEAIVYLHSRLQLLTHPVHPIAVRLYRLTFDSIADRIAREGSLNTGHAAGVRKYIYLLTLSVYVTNQGGRSWTHEIVPT
jgi:hypothetical protein